MNIRDLSVNTKVMVIVELTRMIDRLKDCMYANPSLLPSEINGIWKEMRELKLLINYLQDDSDQYYSLKRVC